MAEAYRGLLKAISCSSTGSGCASSTQRRNGFLKAGIELLEFLPEAIVIRRYRQLRGCRINRDKARDEAEVCKLRNIESTAMNTVASHLSKF